MTKSLAAQAHISPQLSVSWRTIEGLLLQLISPWLNGCRALSQPTNLNHITKLPLNPVPRHAVASAGSWSLLSLTLALWFCLLQQIKEIYWESLRGKGREDKQVPYLSCVLVSACSRAQCLCQKQFPSWVKQAKLMRGSAWLMNHGMVLWREPHSQPFSWEGWVCNFRDPVTKRTDATGFHQQASRTNNACTLDSRMSYQACNPFLIPILLVLFSYPPPPAQSSSSSQRLRATSHIFRCAPRKVWTWQTHVSHLSRSLDWL